MSTIAPARVVLEAAGIRKQFPGVVALDDVSLRLRRGEIQALVGENGAGKSTLIKILTGVYQPDAGRVTIDGAPVRLGTPRDALKSAVTAHETGCLFRVLRALRAQGVGGVFVSHKLEEVFELADRVTVLRDGRNAALDHEIKGLTQDQMVTYMIGRSDVLAQLPARPV